MLDAIKDDGMVGSITNAPEDRSTNPDYMEGLGSDAQ